MLKTSTTPIVGIFKQICCFDEAFLMVLKSTEHLFTERPLSGLRELEILVNVFICAPNNMFTYRIVHLKFCSPQIVVRAHVYTNIPHHAPTTKKKLF